MKNLSNVLSIISVLGIVVGNSYTYSEEINDFIALHTPLLLTLLKSGYLYDVVGMTGVCFYVGSYIALQTGKIGGTSVAYCASNGMAAFLVLMSLVKDFNLSSVTIQVVWILVSLYGIKKYLHQRKENPGDGKYEIENKH